METKIKYSYVILEKYHDLEDGTPNHHYNPAVRVSRAEATVGQFLDVMSKNSNIKGLSIVEIKFELM